MDGKTREKSTKQDLRTPSKATQIKRIEAEIHKLEKKRQLLLGGSRKSIEKRQCVPSRLRTTFDQVSEAPIANPESEGNIICDDPLLLGTWKHRSNIPPSQLNSKDEPIGAYWKHMSNFAFERASLIFPWHVSWTSQDDDTKRRFLNSLKHLYPGNWDVRYVMRQVGNNIREKRVRLRRAFKSARNKESVPCSGGCTLESWNFIYESLSNAQLQAKSEKCVVAAVARTERLKFTHKLGVHGVSGLVSKFVSFESISTLIISFILVMYVLYFKNSNL